MSGIDVREIKLELRYPDSRQEDVTDAFMRGYTGAIEVSNRAIEKLQAENAKLRELGRLLLWGVDNDMPRDEELVWSQKVDALTRELGVEP